MSKNEQIEKLKDYFTKTQKSPFLFDITTGEIKSVNEFPEYPVLITIGNRELHTKIRCGGNWRFITNEWYPVFDECDKYVSWYPYGFEDIENNCEEVSA